MKYLYGLLIAIIAVVTLAACGSVGGKTLPPPVTKPSWLSSSPVVTPVPTETEPTTAPPTATPSPTETRTPVPTPSYTWGPTSCGVERWPVKTGSDADASKVNLNTIVPITISQMNAFKAPAVLPQSNRISPQETTVYQVSGTLIGFKKESDSDYHLILSDGTQTMIAEIPNPGCVKSSSIALVQIEQARAAFDAKFANVSSTSFTRVNVPVTITGIGFFDFKHGQTGVADNGIEIHPVLSIQFGA